MPACRPCSRIVYVVPTDDTLIVDIIDGSMIALPLEWYPPLLQATPDQRNNWMIYDNGSGIRWLDIDISISLEEIQGEDRTPCASCASGGSCPT